MPPGGAHTYEWFATWAAAPGPADASTAVWLYHSHTREMEDTLAGLIGAIIVGKPGQVHDDLSPKDVDRCAAGGAGGRAHPIAGSHPILTTIPWSPPRCQLAGRWCCCSRSWMNSTRRWRSTTRAPCSTARSAVRREGARMWVWHQRCCCWRGWPREPRTHMWRGPPPPPPPRARSRRPGARVRGAWRGPRRALPQALDQRVLVLQQPDAALPRGRARALPPHGHGHG